MQSTALDQTMKQLNADYCLGPEKIWNADNSMGPTDETMECRQLQRTKQGYYLFFGTLFL